MNRALVGFHYYASHRVAPSLHPTILQLDGSDGVRQIQD